MQETDATIITSFLERSYAACRYDATGTPLGGMKVYHEDCGRVVMSTAFDHTSIVPFLVIPGFLQDLQYSAQTSLPYALEKVARVTKQLLGCCVSEVPNALLKGLNFPQSTSRTSVDSSLMDRIKDTAVPLQKFMFEYAHNPELIVSAKL